MMFNFGIVQFLFLQYRSSLVVIRTTCDLIDFIIFEDKNDVIEIYRNSWANKRTIFKSCNTFAHFLVSFSKNLISADGKLFVDCPASNCQTGIWTLPDFATLDSGERDWYFPPLSCKFQHFGYDTVLCFADQYFSHGNINASFAV